MFRRKGVYRSTMDVVKDLEQHGMLLRIKEEVDPDLEMAAIQRRVYDAQGPAIYFEKVKGSPFPAVSNLFGTMERSRFIFRSTWSDTAKAIALKANPLGALRYFWRFWRAPLVAVLSLPKRKYFASVLDCETTIDSLPWIKSWPHDGGPYITLPQVYSEDPENPGIMRSNIGMYRVQLAGNEFAANKEIGIHYQIHRGIGVHHKAAITRGEPLRVAVFVGGPPAHTLAAVMPLPEGLPEVVFAGMLAGRRFRYSKWKGWTIAADADFCIVGWIDPRAVKPEGPFGDHLGYYSLKHDFPYMRVERVFHRKDAVWPFTVVGRPPQEDTTFGAMIHELTKPMVPVSLPGVKAMHAVDAAGVHPLLLAIGSERYVPYANEKRPQEILTQANAILGFNQASLAKYLIIVADDSDVTLDIHRPMGFLDYVLRRVDWQRDLHFYTNTTMDTLDYSGTGINEGSKVVIAATGSSRRELLSKLSPVQVDGILRASQWATGVKLIAPGIIAVSGPKFLNATNAGDEIEEWLKQVEFPPEVMIVTVVDDLEFVARTENNWLWATFTRSNPSHDIYGQKSFIQHKHWGCTGALVIDARAKPHHAPGLIEDSAIESRIQERFSWIWSKDH